MLPVPLLLLLLPATSATFWLGRRPPSSSYHLRQRCELLKLAPRGKATVGGLSVGDSVVRSREALGAAVENRKKGWFESLFSPKPEEEFVGEVETKKEFEELIASAETKLIIVMASMTYCGPCKLIEPKFQLFAEAYPDSNFVKIVGDRNEETKELLDSMKIAAVPAFRVFKNGEDVSAELAVMDKMDIVQAERTLRQVIKRHY